MSEEKRSLVKKLAEVTAALGRIPKNGFNKFHNYHYAMEADVVEAVRGEYAQRHLMLFPSVMTERTELRTTKSGGTENLVTLLVAFTIADGDSGEEQTFHIAGQGQDAGDKGTYKAMTGATKYALMKLHLLPTGDDPEAEDKPHEQAPKPLASPTPKAPMAPGEGATHDRNLSFKFGNDKGKAIGSLGSNSLQWYRDCFVRDLANPEKERFRGPNTLAIAAIDAELRFRAGVHQSERDAGPQDIPQ